MGGGIPLPYVRKKSRYGLNGGFSCIFLNLNTDFIASKTKVKNNQNPVSLVQDYCEIGILRMIGTHQLVYKDLTRVSHVFYCIFAILDVFIFLDIQK